MLNTTKLRTRLLLGYAVPISLITVVGGLVTHSALTVRSLLQKIEQTEAITFGVTEMELKLERMARDTRGQLLLPQNPSFYEDYRRNWDAFQAAVTQTRPLVETGSESAEQKQRFEELVQLGEQYNEFASTLLSQVRQGQVEAAIARFRSEEGEKIVVSFDRLSEQFNQVEQALLVEETQGAKAALNQLLVLTWGVGVLALAIGGGVAILIAQSVARRLLAESGAIASSSLEIATTMEQQERTASQQAASVNETTTTMNELGASSRQAAEQSEAAAAGARHALALAENGDRAVARTLEGMQLLEAKVGAIAEQILNLSEQASQIGSISSAVGELATQTNMLALNAAVEAARAGDRGRGFNVVASEIRKLAEESKGSAERIYGLVRDIQNAVNTAVMVADEGTKTVREGNQIARETAHSFNGVKEAINDIALNSQQISQNVSQQAVAVRQVLEAMNALNRGAQETASGISQVKTGTVRLNEAAENLKAIV